MAILALLVTLLAVKATTVSSNDRPCLPFLQEFMGTDTKHLQPTYYALSYIISPTFGLKRRLGHRTIQLYLFPGLYARRFDIDASGACKNESLNPAVSIPRCVPEEAVERRNAWVYKNAEGAKLYYSKDNPSKLLRKVSPDRTVIALFNSWNNTVSQPDVLRIPGNCV